MKKHRKEIIYLLCFVVLVVVFVAFTSNVMLPKRVSYGANWGSFLQEEKNSIDWMFHGSSLVYCDIIPAVIEEESGQSAYVLAGPLQTIPTTYYYIQEMYRTQNPSVVFVELTGIFYKEFEEYTKVNIGYMPWSPSRIAATFAAAEPSEWMGLLFPLYNYHDRWDELGKEDFAPYEKDPLRGYTKLTAVTEIREPLLRPVAFDERVYTENLRYLQKIADLCRRKNSRLVFFISPTNWHWDKDHHDTFLQEIRSQEDENTTFINFNDPSSTHHTLPTFDLTTDFFDKSHLNYTGAAKLSARLAQMMTIDN